MNHTCRGSAFTKPRFTNPVMYRSRMGPQTFSVFGCLQIFQKMNVIHVLWPITYVFFLMWSWRRPKTRSHKCGYLLRRVYSLLQPNFTDRIDVGLAVICCACNSAFERSGYLVYSSCTQQRATKRITFIFLPRCTECRRGLAMRILSVCLFVCQTGNPWQNGRKIGPDF